MALMWLCADVLIDPVKPQKLRLIEHGLMSPPTQYRLYGRRFLQVKRPNQPYQSTEGTRTQLTQKYNKHTYKHKTQQIP